MGTTEDKIKPNLGDFSDVDATVQSAPFVSYLDQTAIAVRGFRHAGDQLLGLRGGERLLDVGCGTGDATAELAARLVPGGSAVGIDSSEAMIAEERKRAAASALPLEFKLADVQALPFADDHFDACSVERVMVHLAEPLGALSEMLRVLRPGGRLVVREPDVDMIAFDANDRATTRAIVTQFSDSLRNGWIGRQLYRLFESAGFVDLTLHPYPLVVKSFAVFDAMMPFEQITHAAVAAGRITAAAASAWLADLRNRDAAGRFFASWFGFVMFGRKPRSAI
jgi:ubiquinone/menaquinone biosynthesis C-methylase UbiE